ncbi:uncharacterized protein [Apostichopus japonicus]|uniref:uncharacterized protein n=1 Tax=Stichopus japonicus TaxID=307972 RepID=UPI003AB461A4
MGDRLYEDVETARSYQDFRPNYIGLGLEKEVESFMGLRNQRSQNVDSVGLDIGCGNGQLTKVLAPLFTKMIGIDRSKSQIDVANEVTTEKNIEYRVNLAEDLSFLQDGSVDLVSTAAAIHYFQPEPFLAEVDRVLKPGGCLLTVLMRADGFYLKTLTNNDSVDKKCQDLMNLYMDLSLCILREETKKVLSAGMYTAPDYPDRYSFQVTSKRQYDNIDGFVGFLNSSGTLQEYNKQFPEEGDQVDRLKKRLLSILADASSTPESTPVVLSLLHNCCLYKKPM